MKIFIPFLLIIISLLLPQVAIKSPAENPSTGEIIKTQEMLEENEAVRERIEKERKVFIRKIAVVGATLLTKEQIKEIILPFQNHWLAKEEIQSLLDLISASYKKNNHQNNIKDISYQVKKDSLIIQVKEKK